MRNLPLNFHWERLKRRPSVTGEWIRDKERRLGHKIRPYEYCKAEGIADISRVA